MKTSLHLYERHSIGPTTPCPSRRARIYIAAVHVPANIVNTMPVCIRDSRLVLGGNVASYEATWLQKDAAKCPVSVQSWKAEVDIRRVLTIQEAACVGPFRCLLK